MEASTTGQLVDNFHDGQRKKLSRQMSHEVHLKTCTLQAIRTQMAGEYYATAQWMVASHAGGVRAACISSLPTRACSTGNNIPFPLFYSHGMRPKNSFEIKF